MLGAEQKIEKDDEPTQPDPPPLIIPVLPNDEYDPIPPEPIEAPPEPHGQEPIQDSPDGPKAYV